MGCSVDIIPALINEALTREEFAVQVMAQVNATPLGRQSTITFTEGVLGPEWGTKGAPKAGDVFAVAVVVYCQEVTT